MIEKIPGKCFAVIDTETTWERNLMSIGLVIAEDKTFRPLKTYYVLVTPGCAQPGLYSNVLQLPQVKPNKITNRVEAITDVIEILQQFGVRYLFAYNCSFDANMLPELSGYKNA